jgi:uncharacterized membrane protein (DUF441 family)
VLILAPVADGRVELFDNMERVWRRNLQSAVALGLAVLLAGAVGRKGRGHPPQAPRLF